MRPGGAYEDLRKDFNTVLDKILTDSRSPMAALPML